MWSPFRRSSSGFFSYLIEKNHTPSDFGAATRASHSACCTLLVPVALFGGWPGYTHSEVLRLGGSLLRADIVTPRPGDGEGTDGFRFTSDQRRSFGMSVDRSQCLLDDPSASRFVVRCTVLFLLVGRQDIAEAIQTTPNEPATSLLWGKRAIVTRSVAKKH